MLIKVEPIKEKTNLGLYIKEDWKSLPPYGEIMEIGPDVTEVKVGDTVMFDRYASIILEGDLRLCLEGHCFATRK